MDVLNEIKKQYKTGGILIQLIIINVSVFVIVGITGALFFLFKQWGVYNDLVLNWLAVPADLKVLLYRPWTIFTYMFLHQAFMHIVFNMLWLFWFGKIFLEFIDKKKLLSVYLLGGISGAALYILAYNVFPVFENPKVIPYALGASASVYAIVVAISTYAPNYTINLLFIGRVQIKYTIIVLIIIDILLIPLGNAGGHIAHIGGALFGYLFAMQLKKNKDISSGFTNFVDDLSSKFSSKTKMKVKSNKFRKKRNAGSDIKEKTESDMNYNKRKATEQEIIDIILDKISKSGYNSLTKKEKETLFKASKK